MGSKLLYENKICIFCRFIVKAPEKKRRDKNRIGVIIRETADKSIEKFQPKIVPFPFTKASDFEAYIQQPIGRDWNTELTHVKLIKPSVVTQAGRIIRPLDKEAVIKERMVKEMSSSEDEY
jgi:U3 small nucleolar RNA-associated protein 14